MDDGFVTFREFAEKDLATGLAQLLEKHNIEYRLENPQAPLGSAFGDSSFAYNYQIKLRQADFRNAEELLADEAYDAIVEIPADYPVLSFTDEELLDIIANSDEWSDFDVMLAKKLLSERGKEISETHLLTLRDNRIQELSEPEKTSGALVAAGYLFAILGGLLALLIGWHLLGQKTLPNGKVVNSFTENDRKHGRRILTIAFVVIGLSVVAWIAVLILEL
jgi:hypothetical protein